jgi:hypothetical protein
LKCTLDHGNAVLPWHRLSATGLLSPAPDLT